VRLPEGKKAAALPAFPLTARCRRVRLGMESGSPLDDGLLRSVVGPHAHAERAHVGLKPSLAPPCCQEIVVGLRFRVAITDCADETRVRLAGDLEQ
jgi:hypothetical protein